MNEAQDLWTKLENTSEAISNEFFETTILFLGEAGAGKTSLVQSFLKPSGGKDVRQTVGLEYNFARKKNNIANGSSTSLVHIWELGGETNDSKLIEISLNKKTISNLSAIVVLDLSKPQNILASLIKWVKVVRELVKKVISENKIVSKNLMVDTQGFANYQANTKDLARCRPCEIPLYFVANKYDIFKSFSTMDKRAIMQTIRMFAHYHGASLVSASINESALRDSFQNFMGTICFPGKEIRGMLNVLETSIEKPIQICAGRDDFEMILTSSLTKSNSNSDDARTKSKLLSSDSDVGLFVSAQSLTKECWGRFTEHLKSLFGSPDITPISSSDQSTNEDTSNQSENTNEFPELDVDSMRAQRDIILEKYIQEAERREKMLQRLNKDDEDDAAQDKFSAPTSSPDRIADRKSRDSSGTSEPKKKSSSQAKQAK